MEQMQLHIIEARDGLTGWCRSGGWFWFCVLPHKNRTTRWKGPFESRAEVMRSAQCANPQAKIITWENANQVPTFALADLRVDINLQH
jgi:hypothetical protein